MRFNSLGHLVLTIVGVGATISCDTWGLVTVTVTGTGTGTGTGTEDNQIGPLC
jgi:hypothetical protein